MVDTFDVLSMFLVFLHSQHAARMDATLTRGGMLGRFYAASNARKATFAFWGSRKFVPWTSLRFAVLHVCT